MYQAPVTAMEQGRPIVERQPTLSDIMLQIADDLAATDSVLNGILAILAPAQAQAQAQADGAGGGPSLLFVATRVRGLAHMVREKAANVAALLGNVGS